MFREMRRKRQLLTEETAVAILERMTSGVLALSGDEGYPYALPISYVYVAGKIYFHCAPEGHKMDAVRNSDKASFCVIQQDRIVPEEYTTYFRSVIAFGRIRIVDNREEKLHAIERLAEKYAPDDPEGRRREIAREFDRMALLELRIEHLTGKESIELARMKPPRPAATAT